MAFTLWNLFEASILVLNAVCILHEERFLAKKYVYNPTDAIMPSKVFNSQAILVIGWAINRQNVQGFGEEPSVKLQILNLVHSIRTVARFPLIFLNILIIIIKLILG